MNTHVYSSSTEATKLYGRSIRHDVPYDHDLTLGDLDEILTYGMSPFIRWDSDDFTRWLHGAIKGYLEQPNANQTERLRRKEVIDAALANDNDDQYDALVHAIAVGNVSLIRNVYVPYGYFERTREPTTLMLVAQKSGNLEMLRTVNRALIQAKNRPA